MGIATALKAPKNLAKRLLNNKYVKKCLRSAKKLMDRYHDWLFQTRLVYVDREKYLRRRLGEYTPEEIEKAIATSPTDAIGEENTNKVIKRCILRHSIFTALLSAAAAVASDTYMQIILIVFDIIQFQIMTYIVVQKLLYLHGYHDLRNSKGQLCERATVMISAISLLMVGRHKVGNAIKKLAKSAAKKAIRTYTKVGGRVILTNLLRQGFKWLGISATRDTINLSASITIALMCAILADIISFWLFYPMCNRLNRKIKANGVDTISDKIREDTLTDVA
ncbi:MAG: hypothetical protein K6G31_12630 [Paludibacteraceae bacterium]|nr:hypothetical protein [Paludibacteraceae bacterium]